MYVTDSLNQAFKVVAEVSGFAYKMTSYLNNEIAKYRTLLNFQIQIGACYGDFYEFTFRTEDLEEDTTIGYAANYAAKLQGLSEKTYISISSDIYEDLDSEYKKVFTVKQDDKIQKYGQRYYATTNIGKLRTVLDLAEDLEKTKLYANKLNLGDIKFSSVRQSLNFDNLSKKECKKLIGIPLFADVRGFTSQFKKDDSNLEEMSQKTQEILQSMYEVVGKNKGIHVQFQGDREMALFHDHPDYPEYNCIPDAVAAALRIVDVIKTYQVCVGVGTSLGTLFAAKIGARGEKDNILLGTTVTQADRFEDERAGENQIVINGEIYSYLKDTRPIWANQFVRIADDCYRTTVGYKKMMEAVSIAQLEKNTRHNNYNGAWGE
jgi:class 3 adenylate cyclase